MLVLGCVNRGPTVIFGIHSTKEKFFFVSILFQNWIEHTSSAQDVLKFLQAG